MRKKTYKGRCEKRKLEKFEGICKTYDPIQYAYADILSAREDVVSVRCNVWLDGEECSEYMTDFLCTMENGDLIVRECISRKLLTKPQTAVLLDLSQTYWMKKGVKDWGLVIDADKE